MANDYAMATKARALYSKHLKQADYTHMLGLENVSDLASYLKNETRYGRVLEGINEATIHRDYLEQKIKSNAMQEFLALMRYVQKEKHHFYQFYIRELEVSQLVFVLHAIESKTHDHYVKFLNELNHLMAYDVDKLMICKSYDDVLKVVEDTQYRNVLSLLTSENPNLSRVEDNLQEHYNQAMLKLIREEGDNELLQIFNMQLELENLAIIYRMKTYYGIAPKDMQVRLNGPYHLVSKKKLLQWVNNLDGEAMLKAFEEHYGHKLGTHHHIEHYFDEIRFNYLKKCIRTSMNTDAVLFAYMGLITLEINNIVDIIEGVRYKLSSNEIEKQLIY